MALNNVNLAGRLTGDAELRRTASGTAVLNFSIAVNNRRKNNQTGEWEDDPCYVDCTLFGTRAEKLAEYLRKGTKIALQGKLRWSSWERDGQRRSKLDVIVDELELMSGGNQGGGGNNRQTPQSQYSEASYYDESIPF